MIFRTEINLQPSPFHIHHQHQILMFGSCFSQNIGERLINNKFNCTINPFGTIFHPQAIAKIMDYVNDLHLIEVDSLLPAQGIYVHPDFHSIVGHPDKNVALDNINRSIRNLHLSLPNLDFVFITLGTAIGYEFKKSNQIVANCHKLPPDLFTKAHADIENMAASMIQSCNQWHEANPNIRFIFTVSPVRHIKDGIIENARSKAKLLIAIEKICQQLDCASYFPAYEWLMDDLRDYRYYEKDLIHPNDQAIDYIWEKFSLHYFDDKTVKLNHSISKIFKSLQHRPFNPDTEAHQKFVENVQQEISKLTIQYPWIKF